MESTRSFEPFDALRRDVDQLFERFLPLLPPDASASTNLPRLEVLQEDGAVVAHIDLPGATPDDIMVDVHEDRVTVRGERRHVTREVREDTTRAARVSDAFYRSFTLPRGARGAEAEATFDGEVLTIRIPKGAPPAPHRIQVRSVAAVG